MKKNIICYLPADEGQRAVLEKAAPGCRFTYVQDGTIPDSVLQEAHILLGNPNAALLHTLPNLEVVHLNSAGTDGYVKEGVLPKGVILCNATGSYGLAICEHLTAVALMLSKKLHLYRDGQFSGAWIDRGAAKAILGSKTLVVGLGDIGGEFAKRMAALGSEVRGIKRTPGGTFEGVKEVGTFEQLDEWLKEADIVSLSLPNTPATRGVMNRERLFSMKETAILLNVGRGTAIDTDALCDMLKARPMAAAGLDVTDPEPLPLDHPLWQCENAYITPHISGGFHLRETHDRIVALFARNLRAYLAGEPMESVVDFATGYRKSKG